MSPQDRTAVMARIEAIAREIAGRLNTPSRPAAVRKLGLIGYLENTYPRFIGSDFNTGEKFVDGPVRRLPGFKSREQIYSYHR